MIMFSDLGLELNESYSYIKCNDIDISVIQYLPIEEKIQLIQYVVGAALDENTGCFSPVRVEVYFGLAICSWYTDIEIDKLEDTSKCYDLLDSSGLLSSILNAIPQEELEFISDLVEQTISDICRYNNSAMGIINSITANSSQADELINQIKEIMSKTDNKEGLELLSVIKDAVGTD